VKECVEAYLKTALPPKEPTARAKKTQAAAEAKPSAPSGMEGLSESVRALYEAPRTQLSPERAKAIERASWATTDRLVEAFDEPAAETPIADRAPVRSIPTAQPEPATPEEVPVSVTSPADGEAGELRDALGERFAFVLACLAGDMAAQRACARAHGTLPQTLAEEINEAAADLLGDILLEESSDRAGYVVLDEYRSLLE
jgi:hypothetical protein